MNLNGLTIEGFLFLLETAIRFRWLYANGTTSDSYIAPSSKPSPTP